VTARRSGFLLALVVFVACRPAERLRDAATAPPDPTEGGAIYARACAGCHGNDGRGTSLRVGSGVAPPDLTQLSATHAGVFPRDEVMAVVTGEQNVPSHGTRDMPVWREHFGPPESGAAAVASFYAQRQLEALVAYIESIQR